MKTAAYNETALPTVGHWFAQTAHTTWTALKSAGRTFVRSTQAARMAEALCSMNDEQLAHIGITRQGIPAHVEELMNYEYDGL